MSLNQSLKQLEDLNRKITSDQAFYDLFYLFISALPETYDFIGFKINIRIKIQEFIENNQKREEIKECLKKNKQLIVSLLNDL